MILSVIHSTEIGPPEASATASALMALRTSGSRKNRWLALTLPALFCCVTMAQTVTTSAAAGVDFSKYHTYRWVEVKGEHPDPRVDSYIKQSIDSQLAARGLTKTDGAADLNVDYQAAISQIQTWQAYEDWTDNSPMGQRLVKKQMVTIDKGALAVDIYDTSTKHLVWTGRATKTLEPNSSSAQKQKSIDKAAKALLVNFPPSNRQ